MIKLFTTKIQKLLEIGEEYFKKKVNLSRKKFITAFVASMCISRSVQFTEIALHLNKDVEDESNLRRIQLFFQITN